jgi:hypothetical protein
MSADRRTASRLPVLDIASAIASLAAEQAAPPDPMSAAAAMTRAVL